MNFPTMYTPEGLKTRVDFDQIPTLLKAGWTHELVVKEEVPEVPVLDTKKEEEVFPEVQFDFKAEPEIEAEVVTKKPGRKSLK